MKRRNRVLGAAAGICLVASAGAFAALGFASSASVSDYEPTTVGNDYPNYIDERNDIVVEGMKAVMPISQQNTENLESAKALDVKIDAETDGCTAILVTNMTGKDISEFKVKTNSEPYSQNLLSGELAVDGQACWYFTFPGYTTHEYTNTTGVTYTVPDNYTIQVKFADGSTGEFHNLNMNGVRTVNLCWSDAYKVYFVERTTITNHTPDPNLYYEVNRDEGEEGGGDALDFHVNSAARMGDRQITESRGGGWEMSHEPSQELDNYSLALPLYGEPSDDYTDGVYEDLYWNAEELRWRDFDFE